MKNQWFGDQYDFRKYGLLYFLCEKYYKKLLVAWMLTKNDSFKEGTIQAKIWNCLNSRKKIEYAKECFKDLPKEKEIYFYDEEIKSQNRKDWIDGLNAYVAQKNPSLIFFDADNGFDKQSNQNTQKRETYIYLDELEQFIKKGIDILLYQHLTCSVRNKGTSFNDMCITQRKLLMDNGYNKIRVIKASGDLAFFLIQQGDDSSKSREEFREAFTNAFGTTKKEKQYLDIWE